MNANYDKKRRDNNTHKSTHSRNRLPVRLGSPVPEEGIAGVAIKSAGRALEGTLAHDVGHVLEDESAGSLRVARPGTCDATVIVREKVLAHLGTAHASLAHLAREELFFADTTTLLRSSLLGFLRFLIDDAIAGGGGGGVFDAFLLRRRRTRFGFSLMERKLS